MVQSFWEIFYEKSLSFTLVRKPALALLGPMVSRKVFITKFMEKPWPSNFR